VSIFSTFPGEADRIRDAVPEVGIRCINDLGQDKYCKPVQVSDKAEEVVPGSDVIILAIPSFTHELYLRALAPHVKPGVIIGAMPGEGGFDMCARHVLGADFVNQSNIFALETLPWACRILVSKSRMTNVYTIVDGRSTRSFLLVSHHDIYLSSLIHHITGVWQDS
jgi:hypothetical protein